VAFFIIQNHHSKHANLSSLFQPKISLYKQVVTNKAHHLIRLCTLSAFMVELVQYFDYKNNLRLSILNND